MSCPVKYRQLGDFHKYYSGEVTAPYLTVFVGGNHEASSHLWELYYGGWVAPNIYYLGAANVLRFGPIRIAGLSGIWKGFDYRKTHFERLPFSDDDVRSFYHVREVDVRKLLLMRSQVDVGLSHDWPRGIEKHGDASWLFKKKPDFRKESSNGTLGSVAAEYVLDRLRPPFWFSAHLHVKFAALKRYDEAGEQDSTTAGTASNPEEIQLDMDDEDNGAGWPEAAGQQAAGQEKEQVERDVISDEMRAQLPTSFTLPKRVAPTGQPVPDLIRNKEVRFLALDKCLPGRHFLQLCEIAAWSGEAAQPDRDDGLSRFHLRYDPEWLAITRLFHHKYLEVGKPDARMPQDLGEQAYLDQLQEHVQWVEENVVQKDKLGVPDNFEPTAPPHVPGTPEIVQDQPDEYTNPQTAAFCELLGLCNIWDASVEERRERAARGPSTSASARGARGGRGFGRGGGRRRGRAGRW